MMSMHHLFSWTHDKEWRNKGTSIFYKKRRTKRAKHRHAWQDMPCTSFRLNPFWRKNVSTKYLLDLHLSFWIEKSFVWKKMDIIVSCRWWHFCSSVGVTRHDEDDEVNYTISDKRDMTMHDDVAHKLCHKQRASNFFSKKTHFVIVILSPSLTLCLLYSGHRFLPWLWSFVKFVRRISKMVVNVTPSKFDICLISGFLFNFACVTANYWPPSSGIVQGDPMRVLSSPSHPHSYPNSPSYPYSPSPLYPPNYQSSAFSARHDSFGSRYQPPPPNGYGYSNSNPYSYASPSNRYPFSSTSTPYYRPPPAYPAQIPYQYWRTPSQSYDSFADRRGGSGYQYQHPNQYQHLNQYQSSNSIYGPPMLPPNPGPYYPGMDPYGPRVAYAKLQSKTTKVQGEVQFVQQDNRYVGITGRISGLVPGAHGLHVHEGVEKPSDSSASGPGSCENIGGHFNPTKVAHGGKSEWIRHVGDLGNIFADSEGVAYFSISDTLISLSGLHSIVNRTLVVTEFGDDLGKGIKDSKINGNSGKPQACGVIILSTSPYFWITSWLQKNARKFNYKSKFETTSCSSCI